MHLSSFETDGNETSESFARELNEKCAVVGIWNSKDAARDAYFGLFSLQHRGQESSGIVCTDGSSFSMHKGEGLVSSVYSETVLGELKGHGAIGHNRYSTSSGEGLRHAQPIETPLFSLAHNGNIPSVQGMISFLGERGIETEGCSDSKLMAEIIHAHHEDGLSLQEAVKQMYASVTGAFSCVLLSRDELIAFRDPWGMRPLSVGKKSLEDGTEAYVVASETCALDTLGAEFLRDVEPGEIITFRQSHANGTVGQVAVESNPCMQQVDPKFDIFEFVYFARHDSVLLGEEVYEVRKRFGELLAKQHSLDVDIVIPVPETAVPAAIGYSQASGVPLEFGLTKNRYIHRTFIQPTQNDRDTKVRMKLLPLKRTIAGKRVAVIDDSIVRGTTSKRIVKMLFEAGATEVHFLVTSAPIRFPDFYGIDTPNQDDLIASGRTIEQVREYLTATSLAYLSVENMVRATGHPRDRFSLSSFTGEYPIPLFEKEEAFSRNVPEDQIAIEGIIDVVGHEQQVFA